MTKKTWRGQTDEERRLEAELDTGVAAEDSAPDGDPDRKAKALEILRELDDEADRQDAPILAETDGFFAEHEEEMAEAWARRRRSDPEGEDPTS